VSVERNKDSAARPWKWVAAAVMLVIVPIAVVTVTKVSTPSVPSRPATAVIGSIAVLPLRNVSNDTAQQYFADGMTETLTAALSQITGLNVTDRPSAMRYGGTTKSIQQIGRELRVDAMVEGTAQLSGPRAAITVQLVDAASGRRLWANTYDRRVDDVRSVQNEVAQTIAHEIQAKLTSREHTQ
jgi:TolB-like protein